TATGSRCETEITAAHYGLGPPVTVRSRYDKKSPAELTRYFPLTTSVVKVSVVTGVTSGGLTGWFHFQASCRRRWVPTGRLRVVMRQRPMREVTATEAHD